jgi:C1A family cysteine protease
LDITIFSGWFFFILFCGMQGCSGPQNLQVQTPTLDPNGGEFSNSRHVTMATGTADAKIYFTTDGTDPDENSTPYEAPILLGDSATIKARAYKDGTLPSEIISATFTNTVVPDSEEQAYALGVQNLTPEEYDSVPLAPLPDDAVGLVATDEQEASPVAKRCAKVIRLPAKYDLSPYMPPVGYQGNQGSCVAWTMCYALKSYHEQRERNWGYGTYAHLFSPAFVYYYIKVSTCAVGSYPNTALNFLKKYGCATLSKMAYTDKTCSLRPSNAAIQQAASYKISSYTKVNFKDRNEMRLHLYYGRPIAIGIKAYTNFFSLRGNTIYSKVAGKNEGGHEMLLVGYDNTSPGTYKIMNSWGTGFGDKGYCRITYSLFEKIAKTAFVAYDVVGTKKALKASSSSGGRVLVNSTADGAYEAGATATLTAVATSGTQFDHWEGDYTGSTNPLTVNIDGDKRVKAVFVNANKETSVLFDNGNIYLVFNNGTSPEFTAEKSYKITRIQNYHWNDGKGKTPGTIALQKDDGTVYGPWQTVGRPGQGGVPHAYWVCSPQVTIPAGTYTILDSDPASWAQNDGTANAGMSRVETEPTPDLAGPLFDNGNVYTVENTPTNSTTFILDKSCVISLIRNYHWNDGQGTALPGTISLTDAKGTTYGPWATTGKPGQGGVANAYWECTPNITLPAGTYTVLPQRGVRQQRDDPDRRIS